MTGGEPQQLAVLGSPIGHSKSPALHRAAYAVLGLDWNYDAIEVTEATLADFVATRDASWRGLSLTMPLKRAIMPLLDTCEDLALITGSTNTVLFSQPDDQPGGQPDDPSVAARVLSGFNTDVHGLAESFRQAGTATLDSVHILGGGATAASAIAAASLLSATSVTVLARDVSRAVPLVAVGDALGIAVQLSPLTPGYALDTPDAIISTLPGGTVLDHDFSVETKKHSILFDVAYDPWPSVLAQSWASADGQVISGIHMLINQALMQIRIFVSGNVTTPLPREADVLAAMRSAVGV
jgi:shikimate dehydrogenase